jgi:hypothetical protein
MPLSWEVGPKERFVVLTITDPYMFEEWKVAIFSLHESGVFQEHRAVLVDRRAAAPPTTAFAAAVIDFMAVHPEALARRTAILVSDQASFGMARMLALRAELAAPDAKLMAFYGYPPAVSWLTA